MSKSKSSADDKSRGKNPPPKDEPKPHDGGWRETVESIAMAVILALLFRGFVAEAFVIPTGSMAPTLRGRHKDVECPECGLWYQVGASQEFENRLGDNNGRQTHDVVGATCPSCRFTQPLNPFAQFNDGSFSGDRIIVSKFLYDYSAPQRWDVIVFKYPGDATQNYIKRLIGLPGETVRIQGGNIWIRQGKEGAFQIARKPPDKLDVLLQLVNDTDHLSRRMLDANWPLPWIEGMPLEPPAQPQWISERTGPTSVAYATDGTGDEIAWLRYRQLIPTEEEWNRYILADPPIRPGSDAEIVDIKGRLIVDFCQYNAGQRESRQNEIPAVGILAREEGQQSHLYQLHPVAQHGGDDTGTHWVDDLAVECEVDIESDKGELSLDLVRAGVHHQCRIDIATGLATLSRIDLEGRSHSFGTPGAEVKTVSGQTAIQGAGSHRLTFSNCDHEVLLRVDGQVVNFDGPTTYQSTELVAPGSTPDDYGDLMPAGVGAAKAKLRVSQLRVFRDVYYIAQKDAGGRTEEWDQLVSAPLDLDEFLASPNAWTEEAFTRGRGYFDFELGPDQFFPLGDNSPQSQDARTWPGGHMNRMPTSNYVERDLLIGKAMFVYWPHTWNAPIPFLPNPTQMRPIR